MLNDTIGPQACSFQSSPRQFISVSDRKALIVKADELKKAKVLKALHVDVLRFFFFKCPGAFTGEWRPSLAGIAAECGVSPRAVVRALSVLKALGLIDWVRQRTQCDGRSLSTPNRYWFPKEYLALAADALLRLARCARVKLFDWQALKRDRQKAARASLPVPAPAREPLAASPPPRPVSAFSSSLLSSRAFTGAISGF